MKENNLWLCLNIDYLKANKIQKEIYESYLLKQIWILLLEEQISSSTGAKMNLGYNF